MNYKMKVSITDPDTQQGFYSGMLFDLDCTFVYDKETYGNGHMLGIKGKNFSPQIIDLRYDTSFNQNKKEEYLEKWARNYWTGKDGAWAIKSLEITKISPSLDEQISKAAAQRTQDGRQKGKNIDLEK